MRNSIMPAVALCAALLGIPRGVAAMTITVDGYGADGQSASDCTDADVGDCGLREAVLLANATPGADVILLQAGPSRLTFPPSTPDDAATGDLDVTEALTIQGVGASSIIDATGSGDRILDVRAPAGLVTVRDVVLTGGTVSGGRGGAVLVETGAAARLERAVVRGCTASDGGGASVLGGGTLTLADATTVTGNTASGGGGAVECSGTLLLEDATLDGNTAAYAGGLLASAVSTVTVRRSTISRNLAQGLFLGANGGGLMARAGAMVTLVNATVSGNRASNGGGGLFADGAYGLYPPPTIRLTNVTVAFNVANPNGNGGAGGGLHQAAATGFVLQNTIVSDNLVQGASGECSGSLAASLGHNLLRTGGCIGTLLPGDLVGLDPLLHPYLHDNGQGWGVQPKTRTHGLVGGKASSSQPDGVRSPAIDAGDAAACASADVVTDQRGIVRAGLGAACDIGAFEADACGNTTVRDPEACEPTAGSTACTARCESVIPQRFFAARDTMIPEAHKPNNDGGWGYGWIKVSQGAHNYGLIGFDVSGLFPKPNEPNPKEPLVPAWDIRKATLKLRVAQNHFSQTLRENDGDGQVTQFDVYGWRLESSNTTTPWVEGSDRFDLFSYCSKSYWARPTAQNDPAVPPEHPFCPGATWTCSVDPDTRDATVDCGMGSAAAWAVDPNYNVPKGFALESMLSTKPDPVRSFWASHDYPAAQVAAQCGNVKESIRNSCDPLCSKSIECFNSTEAVPGSMERADYCFRTITIDVTESLRQFVAAGDRSPNWLVRRHGDDNAGAFHYFSREGAVCILGNCGAGPLPTRDDPFRNRSLADVKTLMPLLDVELKRAPLADVHEPVVDCARTYPGRCTGSMADCP